MELYKEQDYADAKRRMLMRIAGAVLILAVTVALLILFVGPWRNAVMPMVVCAVGACALFYYMSVKAMPWIRYYFFLTDIKKGRAHEVDCAFKELSDGEKVSDGVTFHPFIVELTETAEDSAAAKDAKNTDSERMLLFDADKTAPPMKPGDHIRVRAFGNYIIAIEAL